jgi:hypothetical protein
MTTTDADPVSIDVTGTTLRASDLGGNSLSFELTGWDRLSDPEPFDEPIDAAVTGRVSEIGYELRNMVAISRLDGRSSDEDEVRASTAMDRIVTAADDDRITLPEGRYRFRFDTSLFVRLRLDGTATVSNRPGQQLTISFPRPTPVTFGFKSPVDYPRHEITLEPTVDGVATGLSHLSASIETTMADRVHRNYRGYPPLLTFGDETDVPDPVAESTPETGIELLVPDRLAALFPAAPLAYYLGARLLPADVSAPILRAPSVDLRREFESPAAFETAAPKLLRRTFFLDLMASWNDPDSPTTREFDRLEAAGIDLEHCANEPLAERLATYLSFPSDPIDDVLPTWPYVMTVEPSLSNVASLPHLLYDMAAVVLPPEDAAGSQRSPSADRPFAQTPIDELTRRRTIRGVLGDVSDAPGFSAVQRAYENRIAHLEQRQTDRDVIVVFAGTADVDRDAVAERYTQRVDSLSPTVNRLDDPTRSELAAAFDRGTDFLHYVGDCEGGGLACADGTLEPAELPENDVQLFQLDAPASRAAGMELIEAGSIAGVARTGPDPIVSVSTTVGKLILAGQCLGAAYACASAADGDDRSLAVVGDGTHRLVAKWDPSSIQAVTTAADGTLEVTVVPFPVDPVGAHWQPEWATDKRLTPAPITFTVQPDELGEYIAASHRPIYYDGRFYWADEQKQLIYPVS